MKKLGLLVTIALVMVSASLYSQPAGGKDYGKILKKLNLTAEQKKDADRIKVDLDKQLITQKAKIETARLELREICMADSPDKSDIEKKISDIADLEAQAHMIRVDSWFAINTILTPEQQKVWKKVLVEGPAMRHKMMNRDDHKKMMNQGERKEMKTPN